MADPRHIARLLPDWAGLPFQPFRPGVEICPLWPGEPAVALLRYAPGFSVPRHRHMGLETILVLEGAQTDEYGHYPTGSLVMNSEGSEQSVSSDPGCVVLIQWERPVRMLNDRA